MMAGLQPENEFRRFLEQGKFMIQRCRTSGQYFFYPRVAAPVVGSTDLEWVEASGRAEVYATTVVRQRNAEDDFNVVIVSLHEGPRMMSRVDGIAPDQVRIGMPLEARIIRDGSKALLVFAPAVAPISGGE